MKKFSHIILSVLLSMTILFVGSGINILRCAHSGHVKILTALNGKYMSGMDDMGCSMTSKCMSVTHFELSPTMTAQDVSYDFHALQPLLAVLPCLAAVWNQTTTGKAMVQPLRVVWKSPPRDYLNLIRVLLI